MNFRQMSVCAVVVIHEFGVVNAHKVPHGRMEVIYARGFFDGVVVKSRTARRRSGRA